MAARTAVLALIAAAGCSLLFGCTGGGHAADGSPRASAVPSGAQAASLRAGDARRLEDALTARDSAKIRPALAPELRADLSHALLPVGSSVSIHVDTMRIVGDLASVQATVKGTEPGRYALLLERVSGEWLLYGTRKL